MRTVNVNASKNYNVYIGKNILDMVGQEAANVDGATKAIVITDSNVDGLYSDAVMASIESAGLEVCKFVFPAGEESKHLGTLSEILSVMAQHHLSRKDVAIALGGGVVGDITGFAAAVYMRGIKFIQIPTTVLAAVDSSVGGKTAVDLPEGKNLAGAFHQPEAVICDTVTFKSLPTRDYNNGFAEIIKYGAIADDSILDEINPETINLEDIIEKSVKIKAQIVEEDEFEAGTRQLLNFGHSIGHAVEKASDFQLLHGEAVGVGMMMICLIAQKLDLCNRELKDRLEAALCMYNLPREADYEANLLLEIMKSDKKASADAINLIVPTKQPGKCQIRRTDMTEMEELMKIATGGK